MVSINTIKKNLTIRFLICIEDRFAWGQIVCIDTTDTNTRETFIFNKINFGELKDISKRKKMPFL